MPVLIARLLDQTWFGYVARAGLTFMFWASGLAKLIDFPGAVTEMAQFNLAPAGLYALATIIVQLTGSVLIIVNRYAWFGCGLLAVFTALTIPIAHAFWRMEEPQRTMEFYVAMEHLSIIGALAVAAILSRRTGGLGNGPANS